MKRITIGNTGLEVNRMGFGGIPIQRVDEAQAVETVRHAIEKGVDFIDTSRAYTTSERRIGLALKQTDKKVVIASKSQQKTAEGVIRDLETSLNELQLERIDLYQAHFVRDRQDYLGKSSALPLRISTLSDSPIFSVSVLAARQNPLVISIPVTFHQK